MSMVCHVIFEAAKVMRLVHSPAGKNLACRGVRRTCRGLECVSMVQVDSRRPTARPSARADRRRAERAARRRSDAVYEAAPSARSPLKSLFGVDFGKHESLLHKAVVLFAVVAPLLATVY